MRVDLWVEQIRTDWNAVPRRDAPVKTLILF